jgi:hypothetical protein
MKKKGKDKVGISQRTKSKLALHLVTQASIPHVKWLEPVVCEASGL